MIGRKVSKLESDPLWREACELAEYMYGKLAEIPEEEQWDTETKLRHTANDLMYYVAGAIGNVSPANSEYDWGSASKSACALMTVYRFACRQKFISIEPEIMVRLDKLIDAVGQRVEDAYAQTEAKNMEDFERWRGIMALQKEVGEKQ